MYIYSPYFTFLPFKTATIVAIVANIAIFVNFKYINNLLDIKKYYKCIIYILMLISISLITSIINNAYQIFYMKSFILMIFECLNGAIFFIIFFCKNKKINNLLKDIILIIFIQSLIVIFMTINDSFRSLIFSITLSDGERLYSQLGIRGTGLSLELLYSFSFIQSIGLICISIIINKKVKKSQVIYFTIVYLCIFISVILIARTGLIGALISIIILLKDIFRRKNFIRTSIFLVCSIFICFVIYKCAENLVDIDAIMKFAFEFYYNMQNNNGISTSSTNVLMDMYKNFQINSYTAIIGDGYYFNPFNTDLYYGNTDVGYMRSILYFGIIGTIVFYKFIIYMWKNIVLKNSRDKLSLSLIFIYCFITNFKGDIFMSLMVIKIIMVIFIFSIVYDKNIVIY